MISFLRKLAGKNKFFETIVYFGFLIYEMKTRLIFIFFGRKPIENKKIVITAMQGTRYGDNPYYISEVLRQSNNGYDIVWLLKESVEDQVDKGIRRVNYDDTFASIKELATAHVWIDCNMKYSGFIKRKKQIYIQTWHGSYGLKKIGFDLGDKISLIDKRNMLYNSKRTDIMLSNSQKTTEIYKRAFGYNGEMIEKGSPRNDMLLNDNPDIDLKVRKYFGLSEDINIVLYAPTYRNDYSTDSMKLDFYRLKHSLENRFGGTWVILIRLHYKNMCEAKDFIKYDEWLKNATDYGVMQELLVASRVLVTDYSSCMFDFATTKKTCFIYASDLEKYNHDRGNYFAMDELPFPMASTNDELDNIINNFEKECYVSDLDKLFEKVGLNETGVSSLAVAEYVGSVINEN